MTEHRKGNGIEGIEDLMKSARKGIVYSFGGVLVLAILASVGLRQAGREQPASPALPATVSEASGKASVSRHMPRTFHEMERPHPLHLLTPEPLPSAIVP